MSKNDAAARAGLFGLSTTEMLLMTHSLSEVLSFAVTTSEAAEEHDSSPVSSSQTTIQHNTRKVG